MKLSFKGLTPKHQGPINSARSDKFDTHTNSPSSSRHYQDEKTPDQDFSSPKSARFQGFDTETPRTKAKSKLFKISTHLKPLNIHPVLSLEKIEGSDQQTSNFSSEKQMAQSARFPKVAGNSPFYVKETRSPVITPGSKNKYQKIWVSRPGGKDGSQIPLNDLIWQSVSFKHMRTERSTDPSQDFDRVKLLMTQCDYMSQEVGKMEKKITKDEAKLHEEAEKLEQTSPDPDQPQAKEFWKTNQAFLHQRAKMKLEIEKFRNQKKEKEADFQKRKMKAQMLDLEPPVEEQKDPNNESMEQKNHINELILQVPRIKGASVSKKKMIEDRIRAKIEVPEFNLEDKGVPEDAIMRSLTREFEALVGDDNADRESPLKGSHIRKINTGRFPFQKSERIPKLNLQELDNKIYYTAAPTKNVEVWNQLGHPAPASNRHFTMRTNHVSGWDVKKRQQVYLAQFKPQSIRTERSEIKLEKGGVKGSWDYHHRKTISQSGGWKTNR